MSVEILQSLSVISYILSGLLFLAAAALFFLLNIPSLIGSLTGRSAKRAIENIRLHNEGRRDNFAGTKPRQISKEKTDKISSSKRLTHREAPHGMPKTQKFATTELQKAASDTVILSENSNETTLLKTESSAAETTIIGPDDNRSTNSSAYIVETEISFLASDILIE